MESKEATISKNLILKHFSFLESEGYTTKIEEKDSEFFLESFNLVYTNQIRKREISIGFTKSKVDEEIKFTFSATVVRIPYNDPYEDFFSLYAYCNATGNELNTTIAKEFDEKEAELIVIKIAEFIQRNVSIFVHGIKWEKGFYPKWS